MSHDHTHEHAQEEELAFWQTPGAELGEQLKQLVYARYLGLYFIHDGSSPFVIDMTGKRVLDVGGGPVSLLLKTIADKKVVIDPCAYPKWVDLRYKDNGVEWWQTGGENIDKIKTPQQYDEVWMYNVLQHTEDPQKIFENIYKALKSGGTFRFLDWIDTPTNVAHPISLGYEELGDLVDNTGFVGSLKTEDLDENGAVGKVAYGIFTK